MVGTLRGVFEITIEKGAHYRNPAAAISKQKPRQKKLTLPSQEQFEAFVNEIRTAGAWCSKECGDLVEFLAYGGFRKVEAKHVTFADCDFKNDRIRVFGDPDTRTKNGEFRTVPMIPEMKELLGRIKERREVEPTVCVLKVNECQEGNGQCWGAGGRNAPAHAPLLAASLRNKVH